MTLGGTTFIYNGEKYDYNYKETIQCLQACCDQVVVCVINSDDGTLEGVRQVATDHTKVIVLDDTIWNLLSGKERLSHFSNIAIANLDTIFNLYIQADEVLHEDSFPVIRKAIHNSTADSFMCRRYNLWNTPYQMLNVPQERKPCSTEVIRLARTKFRCVDDAESLGVYGDMDIGYLDQIEIFHAGFVRKKDKMKAKIINIQENIFQTPHDARLDVADVFRPMDYFSPEDLIPIPKSLPKFIQAWAAERS